MSHVSNDPTRSVRRLNGIWDRLVIAEVALLLFFTPFAFGAVDVWASSVAEATCFSLVILWRAKSLLSAGSREQIVRWPGISGLAIPGGLLLALMLFQLVPLPSVLLREVSPGSYRLYQKSLPGWPNRLMYEDPEFEKSVANEKATRAMVQPTRKEVRREASAPGWKPQTGTGARRSTDLVPNRWRSLSVAPTMTRAAILKCLAYASLFLVVVLFPAGEGDPSHDRKFLRVMLLAILAAGTTVAIVGLTEQAFWNGKILWFHVPRDWGGPVSAMPRASGPFVNPDHFANYIAMTLPLALVGAIFRTPLAPTRHFSGFQMLCTGASLAIVAAILVSQSRAGWAEIGLSVLLLAWFLQRHFPRRVSDDKASGGHGNFLIRWIVIPSVGLSTILAVALLIIGANARQQAGARVAVSISEPDFFYRWSLWADSVGIVRDYPLFGAGLGSWPVVFPHYQRPPWSMNFVREAHNDYVEAAAECGTLGLIFLGWLVWMVGQELLKGSRSLHPSQRAVFAALISAVVIMGFHELVDCCLQIPANAVLFVLLLAIAFRMALTNSQAKVGQVGIIGGKRPRAILAIIALSGTVAAACQHETMYPEDLPFPQSLRDAETLVLSRPSDPRPHLWFSDRIFDSTKTWKTRELEAAIWLDPNNPAGRDRYVQALLSEGDEQKALGQISTSVYLSPRLDSHAYLGRSLVLMATSERRAAVEAVETGLRTAVASRYDGSVQALAQFYSLEGRELDSARIYEDAARRENDESLRADDYIAAGEYYARAGRRDKAQPLFMAVLNIVPNDSTPYRDLLTLVYAPEKDGSSADKIIRTALSNGIPPAPLYASFGESAERNGDYQTAEMALQEAVSFEPSYSNLLQLGILRFSRAEFDGASEALRRATEVDSGRGEAYFYLARSEEAAYQYPRAIADYQRAIALAPDNSEFKAKSLELLRKIDEDHAKAR